MRGAIRKAGLIRSMVPLILAVLLPGVARAADAPTTVSWTDLSPGDDWTATVLDSLFPMNGAAQTATGTMVAWFTAYVGLIAAAWMMYSTLIQIHKTAETGKVFSTSFSGWVPIRIISSVIMMLPVDGGFGLGQNMIVTGAKGSIGMARNLEAVVLNAVGPQALPLATPTIPGSRQIVLGVMESEACRMLINLASNNSSLVPEPTILNDGNGTMSVYYNMASGNQTVEPTCGRITLTTPVRAATSTQYPTIDFSAEATMQEQAIRTLITNVRSGLINTVQTLWATRDVTALKSFDALFVAQTAYLNGQFSSVASSVVSKVRATAGDTGRSGGGMTLLSNLGWSGLGAYYLEIGRLNGEVMAMTSVTPTVTPPSWQGTGAFLSQDLAPLLKVVSEYMTREDQVLQTADQPWPDTNSPRLYNDARTPTDAHGAWGAVTSYLQINESLLDQIMQYFVMPSAGSGWVDPLSNMIGLGHFLIHLALMTMILGGMASSPVASALGTVGSIVTGQWAAAAASAAATVTSSLIGGVIKAMMPFIITACLVVLSAGVTLAYVLPMTPCLYWIAGVTGWLVLVTEAVAGASLWFLAHMTFAGDGIHGKGIRGYEILFSILFRPPAMVMGMMFSYTIFSAISWLLMKSFLVATAFTFDHGWLLDNLVGVIAMIILYIGVEMTVATTAFRLISTWPHHLAALVGFSAASRVESDGFERSSTAPVHRGAQIGTDVGTKVLEDRKDSGGNNGPSNGTMQGGFSGQMDTTTAAQVRPITPIDV